MDKSGYNFRYQYFMKMGVDNLLGLSYHEIFYKGVIFQVHQNILAKGTVGICIPRAGRARKIWYKVFLKLRVSFDGMKRRNINWESK